MSSTEAEQNKRFQKWLDDRLDAGKITTEDIMDKRKFAELHWQFMREDIRRQREEAEKARIETFRAAREARFAAERAEREARARAEKERLEKERLAREEAKRREEHIAEVTSMDLPMDWENLFCSDERTQDVFFERIPDALISSLNTLGRVDIEYIASVTGQDCKSVILALKGTIYQNPETWEECFYKGWELSDEYLSGNLMRKWKIAKAANRTYHGYFTENLRAIEAVLPPSVAAQDIYVTLGSPWVPPEIIDDFITDTFGDVTDSYYISTTSKYQTVHDELTGTWEIPYKSRYGHNTRVSTQFGTRRMEALHILEASLNMKAVVVYDEVSSNLTKSGVKRVVNEDETAAALEKQQQLIREFQKWVWKDDRRRRLLERIFEERYSAVRRRIFDGSFLELPGLSPSVKLYPYQRDAVARIIFTPNTLLAHDVGAGKTYIMIAAGQELRRMRLSKKNLYVVPNNLVGQWATIFLEMYPDAKLLCVSPKTFSPDKREKVLAQIRDEDFDGIIMAYSSFNLIPLSQEYLIAEMEEQLAELEAQDAKTGKSIGRLKIAMNTLRRKIADLREERGKTRGRICFDSLGITRLFVDEAHNFKNIPISTKIHQVLGISTAGSQRCLDMLNKVHMVQKQNGGKGAVLATGTPNASPYQH